MPDISINELEAIKEQLESEMITVKKYKIYANLCKDPQLKTKLEQLAARHQNHFTQLLNSLG